MGVDVVLMQVQQAGTSPRRRKLSEVDAVVDGDDVFSNLCTVSSLPMLSRVDAYGSLVLTSVDMDQFIVEIDATRRRTDDRAQRNILDEIDRLARLCKDEPLTELHLDGD